MILRIYDRFLALLPCACPVFLLPAIFLSGFLLGSVFASVLVAVLEPGPVTPGFSPTGGNPPVVLPYSSSAPFLVLVGRHAD